MIFPGWGQSKRGASVLAALVVAAVLASAGLFFQETGPLAILEREQRAQTAVGAITQQSQGATETKEECDYRYDYEFAVDKDGSLKETRKLFCATNASACVKEGTELVPRDKNRKSSIVATSQEGTKVNLQCDKDSKKNDVAKQGVATAGFHDLEKGDITASDLAESLEKLGVEPIAEERKQLTDALLGQKNEIESAMDTLGQEAQRNAQALNEMGCLNGGGSATWDYCLDLTAKKEEIEKKWESLSNQYSKLESQQKALAPAQDSLCAAKPDACVSDGKGGLKPDERFTSPGGPGTQTPPGTPPPGPVQPPPGRTDTFGPPGGGGPGGVSAACQACQRGNESACLQCSKDQGNGGGLGGMPKGGGSGGGSGGGGQQQQQCQPQYFCNGNTLMHAQCYNQQPGNAQQIQQCPAGYACQNNACQPSAQHGYCADGRTPRTAPAQPQPAASTCTVGAWEDASNGCQTSWRCVPKGTGANPSAQLSCQPSSTSVGATVNITYACANGATVASSTGFSLASAETLSGTASATVQKPGSGTTITYGLTCTNASVTPALTASEQCTVRVASPTIVLVATPEKIVQSEADEEKRKSTIGWVTSGMQKCTISSPDFATWSEQQAGNTSVAGAVVSPVIPPTGAQFNLGCTTLGGTTATSSVRVTSTP